MDKSIIIFDLDGTLVDSSRGIINSVCYALDKRGYTYSDRKSLEFFIGPPLKEQFMKYCNVDENEGKILVDTYREYYPGKGIYECELYEGIEELLKLLKDNGKTVVLATSKPENFAKIVLDYVGITKYFDYVAGALLDNTRTDKASVIEYALKSLELYEKREDAVMIGDCIYDIIGAEKNGIDSIAVTYGFGEKEQLYKSSAVVFAENVKELENILL